MSSFSLLTFGIQQFPQLLISFSDAFSFRRLHALPWKQQGVLTGIVMLPPCLNRSYDTANRHQQNNIQTHHVKRTRRLEIMIFHCAKAVYPLFDGLVAKHAIAYRPNQTQKHTWQQLPKYPRYTANFGDNPAYEQIDDCRKQNSLVKQ